MRQRALVMSALIAGFALLLSWSYAQDEPSKEAWDSIHERCAAVLRTALAEETEWVRVHAAEALLWNGIPANVVETFAPEVDTAPPMHRIGVWRVLAQAQQTDDAREDYVARIRAALIDVDGPDRLHAAETLAKLGDQQRPDELLRISSEETGPLQSYSRWVLANSGGPADETAFAELLTSPEAGVRGGVAYGLRFFDHIQPDSLARLETALANEPLDSTARVYMASASYVHAPQQQKQALREELLRYARAGAKGQKYEAGFAFGRMGDVVPLLALIEDEETDVRISAANGLLAIERTRFAEDGLPLQPFSYHEGFEGECPAMTIWAEDGPATVNFSGPTEEQAFSGKRSLKFDLTIDGGHYHYCGVSLRVPAEGKLTLSGRMFVAEGTTASIGFGTNMVYPPTHHSGCSTWISFDAPTNSWHGFEVDLVARGRSGAAGVMEGYTADTRGEEVGAYLDRWSLFIYGGEGKRAVIYLDDIRVEGHVPNEVDYKTEIDRRWEGRQERLRDRIAVWREDAAKARQALDSGPEPAGNVREIANAVKASAAEAEVLINDLCERGYADKEALTSIEAALSIARFGPETIRAVSEGIAEGLPYVVYTPPAITGVRLANRTFPIPARIGTRLACSACRGEYESVTAVIYALEDAEEMLVEVGDLTGDHGGIPAASVDVHVVKSWYQAGPVISPNGKLLMPELLLKDAGLVRVDHETEQNYLRSTTEDGTETYRLCSGPTSGNLKGVRPVDADQLQPVNIPARSFKQFWLIVHVPADAAPGLYVGDVSFTTAAGSKTMPFEVTVRPFELLPSRLTYSIYYRARLSADGRPNISSEYKSEKQYRAEMEDLLAHGVLYPTNYQGMDTRLMHRVLEIRKEVGLPTDRLYNLGRQTGAPTSAEELAQLHRDVKQ